MAASESRGPPEGGPLEDRPAILCLAGLGDGAEMFAPLRETELAAHYRLVPIDLPGFCGRPALEGPTTLAALAEVVHEAARREAARIVVAHSVASIVASLAARRAPRVVDRIVSLEGNLTAADAYFSGTAADYPDPGAFRAAFLARLDALSKTQPIFGRWRALVAQADPRALWELGCDARRFSEAKVPGEVLREAAAVCHLYNPDNCPEATLEWLDRNPLPRIVLAGASHWPSVEQPQLLSRAILEALAA